MPGLGTAKGSKRAETALQRAERLRDAILKSKLTAADPWAYTPKARVWAQRAQQLVNELALRDDDPELEARLAALSAEVEADPDFQEACRRF